MRLTIGQVRIDRRLLAHLTQHPLIETLHLLEVIEVPDQVLLRDKLDTRPLKCRRAVGVIVVIMREDHVTNGQICIAPDVFKKRLAKLRGHAGVDNDDALVRDDEAHVVRCVARGGKHTVGHFDDPALGHRLRHERGRLQQRGSEDNQRE